MAFDSIIIRALVKDIAESFIEHRVDKIFQPEKDEIGLQFRSKDKRRLMISVSGSMPHFNLTSKKKNNPLVPPNFLLLLRKHLGGAILKDIHQLEFERIVRLEFEGRTELGDLSKFILFIEIMGRHSNVILCDPDYIIIDALKRVSPSMSSKRPVYPGLVFEPYIGDKLNPLSMSEDKFVDTIISFDDKVFKAIYSSLQGISPALAKEIANRAGIDPDQNATTLTMDSVKKIHLKLNELLELAEGNFLFYDENGFIKDFHVIKLGELDFMAYDSTTELLDGYFVDKDLQNRMGQRSSDLKKLIDNRLSRAKSKLSKLEMELTDTSKASKMKLYGELILSNLYQIEKGMNEVTVLDYYSNEDVTIPLDFNKTPQENSQLYFKKYNKLKNGAIMIEKHITETQIEIEYLGNVLNAIQSSTDENDIMEIRNELVEEGYLKRKRYKKTKSESSSPLHFVLESGIEILVGKNNKQNDQLTFKVASKNDIWLHTKDIPGSHVVIRCSMDEVSDEDLIIAGELAAYYSKARHSSKVPVDYTEIRHVKKPSGSKPGFVNYFEQSTLYVTPREDKIKELTVK